jgi:hypothetical protein
MKEKNLCDTCVIGCRECKDKDTIVYQCDDYQKINKEAK